MLITEGLLSAYGVVVEDGEASTVAQLIRSASSAITSAAGCPILEATSTVTVLGVDEQLLELPGTPIRRIEEVKIDGRVLDPVEYRRASRGVYRAAGWGAGRQLPEVTVTYFHGLAEVPADVQELCASMVIAGLYAARDDAWGLQNGRTSSIRIDDYQESHATSGEGVEQVTPMALPQRTREALRQRFGGSVHVVSTV